MSSDEMTKIKPKEEKVNKNFVFVYETLKAIECSRSIREIWGDFTAEYYVRFRTRISLN